MPENEFELYLSLLSRFLRLKPAQHGEIADELRDHLEARLAELTARGLSREDAIRQALDEFGDAAELANHFTHLAHVRKRRLIMRFTFGTVAALAASLLVATAFWPETPQAPAPQRAVAQVFGAGQATPATNAVAPANPADDDVKLALEAKLNKRIGVVEFRDVPISDVLTNLSELIEIDILIDQKTISEHGIAVDSPVNIVVVHANVTARVALDLILEPHGLSYTIRDGLVMVTTRENANQILVYNVRDLVPSQSGGIGAGAAMGGGAPAMTMMMGGGSTPAMPAPNKRAVAQHRGGFIGGGAAPAEGGSGGGLGGGGANVIRETDSLADLIAVTIDPESWDDGGGQGSIVQYRDLLVVKNSQTVHGKIKVLLDMLRTSSASGAPALGGRRG